MFFTLNKIALNDKKDKYYRRAVMVGSNCLLEESHKIVGYVQLQNDLELYQGKQKTPKYTIHVLEGEESEERIKYLKRFIRKAEKWENKNHARRTYICSTFPKDCFDKCRFGIIDITCVDRLWRKILDT